MAPIWQQPWERKIYEFTGKINEKVWRNTTSALFRLTPCDLAVRKNHSEIAYFLFTINTSSFSTHYGSELCQFMNRANAQADAIKIEEISRLEAFVRMKNKELVKGALIYPITGSTLVNAFHRGHIK